MKKILFFINTLTEGGAQKVLVTLTNELCKYDYDITVCVLYGGGSNFDNLDPRIHQIVVFKTNIAKDSLSRTYYKYRGEILSLLPASFLHMIMIHDKYDIEIAYLEGISTKIVSGGSKAIKKYAWVHINQLLFDYSKYSYVSFSYETKCYKRFNNVFCVSNDVKQAFTKKFGVSASVLYNAIDGELIVRKGAEPIDEEIFIDGKLKLIGIGRLEPQKAFDKLILACAELKRDNLEFELVILGKGKQNEELQRLIKKEKLENNVKLYGYTSNPYPYMKQADLLVCSSITEGYSTAVCESIILGTPVLTTNCTGMREIFGDSGCGMIVDNSIDGLYCALKEIIKEPALLNAMGNAAKDRSKYFNLDRAIQEYRQIL